jgi:hypothetical protein
MKSGEVAIIPQQKLYFTTIPHKFFLFYYNSAAKIMYFVHSLENQMMAVGQQLL